KCECGTQEVERCGRGQELHVRRGIDWLRRSMGGKHRALLQVDQDGKDVTTPVMHPAPQLEKDCFGRLRRLRRKLPDARHPRRCRGPFPVFWRRTVDIGQRIRKLLRDALVAAPTWLDSLGPRTWRCRRGAV